MFQTAIGESYHSLLEGSSAGLPNSAIKKTYHEFCSFLVLSNTTSRVILLFSVKYSGLYSYYLSLFLVGRQIWQRCGQPGSTLKLALSIFWRLLVLIVIPLSVYVGVFYTHLTMLPKAGPHDSVMTSAFQASLQGGLASITRGQPLHVAHGSQITLRYVKI